MFENYSERARHSLLIAKGEAERHGHDKINTAHILLGILKDGEGLAMLVLMHLNINPGTLRQEIERRIPFGSKGYVMGSIPFAPEAKKVLEYAMEEAQFLGHDFVGTEHILLGILREKTGLGGKLLRRMGADVNAAREAINHIGVAGVGVSKKKTAKKASQKTPSLDEFGTDLTQLAREGKLDPVIGREREIERVITILSRKTKNNPVLLGEPGVGKTAIVEGLAQAIVAQKVPVSLMDYRIISIDMGAVVAGTKYRGQFESRIKNLIKEATQNPDIILFMDEIHMLVGAGAAEGAMDASNLMKPALARGELRCIGATTLAEYRKYIEKDGALERRFQPVMVDPPSVEYTIEILRGLKSSYEEFHKVEVLDEALEAAAKLSDRYLSNKFLPDKAIDVLDEACSTVKIDNSKLPPDILKKEEELKMLEKQRKEAVEGEDYEAAAQVRDMEKNLKETISHMKKLWKSSLEKEKPQVTEEHIKRVITNITGLPLERLQEAEEKRLASLENELNRIVIGQGKAIKVVANAIRRSRVGLRPVNRPRGVFLFLGPTGVGKTRLAEAMAQVLFGDRDALLRFDMSEYQEKHNTSRFLGSPPGYVGYEEGGQLTEAVRKRPHSVVLFDEIEKAHPEVFHVMLQIFDRGRITDGQGRTVDMRNTYIIMTSNVGGRDFFKGLSLGFGDEEKSRSDIEKEVMSKVKRLFPPEFLNRIDNVVLFSPLEKEDMLKIFDLEMEEIVNLALEQGLKIEVTEEAKEHLVSLGLNRQMGARPLKRLIEEKIVEPISSKLLEGELEEGDCVVVDRSQEGEGVVIEKKREEIEVL